MGPTRLLTNIIQRKVMSLEEMSPFKERDNFEVTLTDFARHQILKCLFKADNHNFCPICDGLIYLDSTESDHRIAKAVGGQGVLDNGQLVHPLCNRLKSDLSLEEIRADLFGE